MVKFNNPYKNRVTYPIKASGLFEDLCDQAGLKAGNIDFTNADYMILGNPFTNNEDCRTVLSAIAQLAGGFAKIGRDNRVYITSLANRSTLLKVKDVHKMTVAELTATPVKMLGTNLINGGETIPKENIDGNNYFEDFSKNNKWGEVNSLVLRLSETEGENTVLQDNESIEKDGLTEIVIEDNPFLISQRERVKVITPLWNALKGISYVPFKTKYYGFPYLDVGDMLEVADMEDRIHYTYVFNHTFEYNGSFSGELETQAMTKTQTAYKNVVGMKTRFKQTERKIDKINGEIEDIVEEQTDFSNELTSHRQDINSITNEINRIYDFTKTVEGTNELLLEDCLPTDIFKFEVEAKTIKGMYPHSTLYPSKTLFPIRGGTTITIVVGRTSRVVTPDPRLPSKTLYPSKKLFPRSNGYYKREYSFHVDKPLRNYEDIHDKFVIEIDEESGICIAKVLRYIEVDYATGVTTILDEPIEEIVKRTHLKLYKGNNYIYLKDFTDWKMKATYIFNNELNEWYSPRVETNAKIRETADEIDIKISEKAGKDEIVSLINLSPEQIKIQSNKLQLEGLTTINGGFKIDEEGNASIANDTVVIDDKGIRMKDGASLVGGKGLLSNLQFVGLYYTHGIAEILANSFVPLGYYGVFGESAETKVVKNEKSFIQFLVDIPKNFTIAYAYVTIYHAPTLTSDNSVTKPVWGTTRNIGIYSGNINSYLDLDINGFVNFTNNGVSKIEGAFGNKDWTPTIATSSKDAKLEMKQSNDISNYIRKGEINRIIIQTTTDPPKPIEDYWTNFENIQKFNGGVFAVLNVFGYMKLES